MSQPAYRAAVIGRTGRGDYGHGLDRVWKEIPRADLVAVADDDKTGLAAAMRRLGLDRGYLDYREMLDKEKPHVVSIAPRWIDRHAEMVREVASRGVHIYIEKPLCRTLEEADAIVAACERSHVKLAIAYQTRYSPKLSIVQQLIDAGRIGRVLEFRARGKEDARGGAEDLWVLSGHLFNLIRYFAGDPSWCLARVTQNGRGITKEDVVEGNEGIGPLAGDQVQAMYGLRGGQTALFASVRRAAAPSSRFGVQVFGTGGIIEMQTGWLPAVKLLEDPSWSPGRSGARWQDVTSAGVGIVEPLPPGDLHAGNVAAVNDLLDAIEEERQPLANVYEARAVTEMIVAPFESQRLGGLVEFPLANRQNPLTLL
jgi:predicted dehydrogenase